jgi:hypothetical protein
VSSKRRRLPWSTTNTSVQSTSLAEWGCWRLGAWRQGHVDFLERVVQVHCALPTHGTANELNLRRTSVIPPLWRKDRGACDKIVRYLGVGRETIERARAVIETAEEEAETIRTWSGLATCSAKPA